MNKHNYSDSSQSITKSNNLVQKTPILHGNNIMTQSSNASSPVIKKLTRAENKKIKLKGLCYNCNELLVSGHQCKKTILPRDWMRYWTTRKY